MFMAPNKVARTVCLGIIISMLLISNCSRDPDEADVINISNTPRRSEHPAIAADSRGYFYVVWSDNFVNHESLVVYMAIRSPAGVWAEPVKIFEPRAANFPDIEVDITNKIHLIWRNTNSAGWGEVLYTQKALGGAWTEPGTLSIYGMSACPDLAVDNSGDVHIVWQELVGSWPIFYIKKAGGTWGMPVEISKEDVFSRDGPHISLNPDGDAHVVWGEVKTDIGPLLAVYTTNAVGDTFSHPQDINSIGDQYHPSIAVDNEEVVHVVWGQDGDVFYTYKAPGSQWHTPARICSTSLYSGEPDLIIYDNTLHLIWREEGAIYYTSKQQGVEWAEIEKLHVDIQVISDHKIAASLSGVGIVFSGYTEPDSAGLENLEIFFIEVP